MPEKAKPVAEWLTCPMGCGTKFQGPFALRQHLSRDLHSVPWPERSGMAGLPPEDSKPQVGAAAPRRLRAPSGGTEGGAEVLASATEGGGP